MIASTRTFRRSKRPCRNTARLSARSCIRRWITLFTTTPVRATTRRRPEPPGVQERPEVIVTNGRIATLNPRAPAASALAIRGGNIVTVGSAAEIERLRGPGTEVIDAGGRTVIPGLNDGHTHFIRGGLTYTNEVRWDGVPSLAEALRRVREQAQRTPPPHWVQVIGGWTWAQFAERRYPTLEEINAATGDTPCMIMHLYDRAWLNRAGIRALGWTKDTPNMFGGAIERDASGNP